MKNPCCFRYGRCGMKSDDGENAAQYLRMRKKKEAYLNFAFRKKFC